MTKPETVINRLAEIRTRRRLSAAQLAELAGITRQTIHAIETNRYMPNTAVALRLARILEVTVEEVFRLEEGAPSAIAKVEVEPLLSKHNVEAGRPVQICTVGKRLVAVPVSAVPMYLPSADGVMVGGSQSRRTKAAAALFEQEAPAGRLVVAGCDPAMSVLSSHARSAGVDVVLASCNSSQALRLLKDDLVHMAGTHLRDEITGESNLPAIKKLFGRKAVTVVTFAAWQQGLVVAAGNPKRIQSVADLARRGMRLVNREPGAGSRILLDWELTKAGVKGSAITGYDDFAPGHLPAAWRVLSGLADCCVATESAARAFHLEFIPLATERFDLVVSAEAVSSVAMQRLFDSMQRSAFRRELEMVGGYDTAQTGRSVG